MCVCVCVVVVQADKYLSRQEERDRVKVQLALFRLYCLEQRIESEEEKRKVCNHALSCEHSCMWIVPYFLASLPPLHVCLIVLLPLLSLVCAGCPLLPGGC